MIFLDVSQQYRVLEDEIDAAIKRVCRKGDFVLGDEVERFESDMAAYLNTPYAIGLGSGTDALHLSLRALNIGKGDEVIVTPFTMIASAEVMNRVGAIPVFADIDPQTFNIDPKKISELVTSRTKAILVVHLFGQAARMDEIRLIARKHKLFIIEDVCQSTGASWRGEKLGTIGDIGCFSFFPSKNLGGHGDGGMAVTPHKRLAESIKILRSHGAKKKYHHEQLGVNSRLDTIQAAILRVKLPHLDTWNTMRRELAQRYTDALSDVPQVITPFVEASGLHVYHQYTIKTKNRNALQMFMRKRGIPTMQYYPVPLHLQKAFSFLKYVRGTFPYAEHACKQTLSLKIDPFMTKKEQSIIISSVKDFYAQR